MPVRIEFGDINRNYYVVTRIIARHLSVCLNDHLDLVNHIQRTLLGKKIKTLKKNFKRKQNFSSECAMDYLFLKCMN